MNASSDRANTTLRRAAPRGFTLVEVLIVIALMTILAAVVIPRFEPSIHDQLESAAQIVSADTAYARSLAITNNSTYRLTFDVAENRYVLHHTGTNSLLDTLPFSPYRQSTDAPDEQTTDLDELPHIGPTVELIAVHKIAASVQPVTDVEFGPFGETTRQEETVIWLGCGNGDNRRYISIHVVPVTGQSRIGEFQAQSPLAAN